MRHHDQLPSKRHWTFSKLIIGFLKIGDSTGQAILEAWNDAVGVLVGTNLIGKLSRDGGPSSAFLGSTVNGSEAATSEQRVGILCGVRQCHFSAERGFAFLCFELGQRWWFKVCRWWRQRGEGLKKKKLCAWKCEEAIFSFGGN